MSSEYLPELLPHRENQIKQLANNLLPASKGRKPQNVFLFGPPGIGKTAVVKFVFREFEEYSGIKAIYLNCWDYKTAPAILSEITIQLGSFAQRRGVGKDEILQKLIEICKKMNKGIIVCLDEVDQLKEIETLYDLSRINEYIKNPFGIVLISNNPNIFLNVEPRIKSSLDIEEIEFKPYSLEEMKKILGERVGLAFHSVEEGVILLAANHAVKNGGDVRIGLQCLLKAGRAAEDQSSSKVAVEHMRSILSSVKKVKPEILKEKISDEEKIVLEILQERKNLLSGQLYEQYCSRSSDPVSERFFADMVNHLKEIGLIKIRERKRGIRGKTREISL